MQHNLKLSRNLSFSYLRPSDSRTIICCKNPLTMPFKLDTSSAIYTVLLLASALSVILGALSWIRTSGFFLPLPAWVPILATLLPPLTLAALVTARVLFQPTSRTSIRWTQAFQIINHLHTVLLTVIVTVALAYLLPDATLSCHLEQQWQSFFQQKNSHVIRAIQDGFQCCGLRSIHDRAWPFKDKTHGDNACELQLGYRRSCFGPWREMQQGTSWMVFAAVVCVLVAKVGVAQLSGRRASWMDTRSLGGRREHQRIAGVEGEAGLEEADGDVEQDGDVRRTLLPHARQGQENVWDAD
ncbi:hypothetical protein BJY04DRAFT_186359 [Aspergillus karnatakaensis]|uniref:uncharacterized protein n=1 Tax=Aspergillus karnatakaensis TaxID=1810916 RepID=UPI003CCDB4C1